MNKARSRRIGVALGLMVPALVIYSMFFIMPIVDTIVLSFHSWNGIGKVARKFIGLANYVNMFTARPEFYTSLWNVVIFLIVTVAVIMPVSFALAYFIFAGLKKSGFFKTVFYFPTILPMAATGLMWSIMLLKNGGVVNAFLGFLRLPSDVDWLGNMGLVTWSVALVNAWMFIGQNMLFFLAGLSGIPGDIIEASTIDGASGWKRLLYIVLPCAKESFKTFLVLGVSGCIKVFDIIFVMTWGGPGNASDVPATLLYKNSFIYSQFGYGAAIGVVILTLSIVCSFLLTKAFNRMD